MPIVVLRGADEAVTLPIRIGLGEACAIAAELDNIELDRPLPHDLFTSMLGHLDASVQQVEIRDMVDGTCYATVWVQPANGDRVGLDARPSDALALALRSRAPILVAAHVIESAPAVDLGPCLPSPCSHSAGPLPDPPNGRPEGRPEGRPGARQRSSRASSPPELALAAPPPTPISAAASASADSVGEADALSDEELSALGDEVFGKWKM